MRLQNSCMPAWPHSNAPCTSSFASAHDPSLIELCCRILSAKWVCRAGTRATPVSVSGWGTLLSRLACKGKLPRRGTRSMGALCTWHEDGVLACHRLATDLVHDFARGVAHDPVPSAQLHRRQCTERPCRSRPASALILLWQQRQAHAARRHVMGESDHTNTKWRCTATSAPCVAAPDLPRHSRPLQALLLIRRGRTCQCTARKHSWCTKTGVAVIRCRKQLYCRRLKTAPKCRPRVPLHSSHS